MLPGPVKEERRVGSLDGVIYVTYGEYRQRYREERDREGEKEEEGDRESQAASGERKEQARYTGTYVYISPRRSAGGATGASKNVLST